MKKYVPRNLSLFEATQWFKHGDHEAVYPNPEKPGTGLINDPWTDDYGTDWYRRIHTRVVEPGDYIIQHWDGTFLHIQKGIFENSYKEYVE